MKNFYCFVAILTLTATSKAQTYAWTKTFGGNDVDNSYSIALDNSGNVFVGGTYAYDSIDVDPSTGAFFLPANDGDNIFFSKYDPDGNLIWAKSINSNDNEELFDLTVDDSGNVYITGYFYFTVDFDPSSSVANLSISTGNTGVFLAKYDPNGNYLWAYAFDGTDFDEGLGLKTDNAGNVYLTGAFSDMVDFDPSTSVANLTSFGNMDIFLAKYDALGNYIWAINAGGTSDDFGKLILIDSLNNIYLNGFFAGTADFDPSPAIASLSSSSGGYNYTAKYNSDGEYIWAKNIGANRTYGLCLDNLGHLFQSGYFGGSGDFDPGTGTFILTSHGGQDIYFAKYDTSGNFIWAQNIGGTGDDLCYGMALDGSSNIYLTGGFKNTVDFDPGAGTVNIPATGTTNQDVFLAMYNNGGIFQWVKNVGNTGDDFGHGICINNIGDIYITGWFNNTVDFNPNSPIENHTSKGGQDIFLSKYSNPTTAIQPDQVTDLSPLKIYPNPVNNTLLCETNQNTQLYVYNASGALVLNQQLNAGKHNLDVAFLVPGIYLVRSSDQQNGLVLIKQ